MRCVAFARRFRFFRRFNFAPKRVFRLAGAVARGSGGECRARGYVVAVHDAEFRVKVIFALLAVGLCRKVARAGATHHGLVGQSKVGHGARAPPVAVDAATLLEHKVGICRLVRRALQPAVAAVVSGNALFAACSSEDRLAEKRIYVTLTSAVRLAVAVPGARERARAAAPGALKRALAVADSLRETLGIILAAHAVSGTRLGGLYHSSGRAAVLAGFANEQLATVAGGCVCRLKEARAAPGAHLLDVVYVHAWTDDIARRS